MPGHIAHTYFGCVRLDDHTFTSSTRKSPVNGTTKPLLASPICLIKITQNAKTMLKNHRYLKKKNVCKRCIRKLDNTAVNKHTGDNKMKVIICRAFLF